MLYGWFNWFGYGWFVALLGLLFCTYVLLYLYLYSLQITTGLYVKHEMGRGMWNGMECGINKKSNDVHFVVLKIRPSTIIVSIVTTCEKRNNPRIISLRPINRLSIKSIIVTLLL